jgi:cysteine desulfurase
MLVKQRIYLDNNGSTSLDPRVLKVLYEHFSTDIGNPSSMHSFGQELRKKLNKARSTIAEYLHVKSNEIIFTSGGTEAANMVIRGVVSQKKTGNIITSNVEHSCVYSTIKFLETSGCKTTFLSPGKWGSISAQAVKEAIRPDTNLIALMAVNNETGVKTDIASIAEIADEASIPFVVDGVSLLGKEPFAIPQGVSAMWFSGHKLHAPKGIGFAFVRTNLKFTPLLIGGEQERGKRGGTENVSGAVALAEAISFLENELQEASFRMKRLRDKLESTLVQLLPGTIVNGEGPRICNTTNLAFEGLEGESILTNLDLEGIAVSHGSACASGALEPSRVLLKMGIPIETARSSIRISLSRFTTEEEIDRAISIIVKVIGKLRNLQASIK